MNFSSSLHFYMFLIFSKKINGGPVYSEPKCTIQNLYLKNLCTKKHISTANIFVFVEFAYNEQ